MTSKTQASDTSNLPNGIQALKAVDKVYPCVQARSGKIIVDDLPDREIVIRADAADELRVRYDVEQERSRVMNRLYNLGVPESETTTSF